jgi:Zn-dependent protease/CBS domain-containing protein
MLTGGTLRIGRLAGIELRISSSWLIIFALVVYSLGWGAFPDDLPGRAQGIYLAMAVAAAVLFFASIVVHELAHSLVARRLGIGVESITLFLFGGIATITDEARRARDEFLIAIAGPLASIALAGILWGAETGLRDAGAGPTVTRVFLYLAFVNALLAAFNMLPGFPLDGGRVLRSLVWGAGGSLRTATRVAALCGRGVGLLLIAFGVWETSIGNVDGLWSVLIGWFVISAAAGSERQTMIRDELARATASDVMTPNPLGMPPDTTLAAAEEGWFDRYPFEVYPVRDVLTPLGIVGREQVEAVEPARRSATPVSQVMLPLDGMTVAPATPVLELLPRLRDGLRLLVVDEDGDLRGIVAASDVGAWLRAGGRPAVAR